MVVIEAIEAALGDAGYAGSTILVAASGGVDSMVLLHALAEVAPAHACEVAAGHVHHGLRGREADADAECVRAAADALGLPFSMERVEPGSLRADRPNRERPTLQEAARTLRYQALHRIAERLGAARVATGHTLDDQAETVLMRLLRGTAPDGLGGIPERSPDGRVIRPLLDVPRSEIEEFAAARGLSWREDATNRCDRYTRNRLRRHWLPGLASDFNPQLLRAIGRLAEAQRRDAEWIESIVEQALAQRVVADAGGGLAVRAEGWGDLPEALARRVVARLLARAGCGRDLTRTHVARALEFLRVGPRSDRPRTLELPGGVRLRATHDRLTITRSAPRSGAEKD